MHHAKSISNLSDAPKNLHVQNWPMLRGGNGEKGGTVLPAMTLVTCGFEGTASGEVRKWVWKWVWELREECLWASCSAGRSSFQLVLCSDGAYSQTKVHLIKWPWTHYHPVNPGAWGLGPEGSCSLCLVQPCVCSYLPLWGVNNNVSHAECSAVFCSCNVRDSGAISEMSLCVHWN